jgi:3-methyladenine DNA glycosylase AlkD
MVAFAQTELAAVRNPDKAARMQQYLKTTMPIYGLQKPERAAVEKRLHERFSEMDVCQDSYEACIRGLWDLPHREEKYLAIDFAMKHKEFIGPNSMSLYESMLREDYMWWDLVDPIASTLVGIAALHHPALREQTLRKWINDDNMWIRRTALIAHLKHKTETDQDMLFEFCRLRMHEKEFFIRKAIGWALRQYSYTEPEAVKSFLAQEKSNLSQLSYREGAKALIRKGKM